MAWQGGAGLRQAGFSPIDKAGLNLSKRQSPLMGLHVLAQ